MKDKIRSIVDSNIDNSEKTDKLHELFKEEATRACTCVIQGFINGGEPNDN
jgi:hypothetical protein